MRPAFQSLLRFLSYWISTCHIDFPFLLHCNPPFSTKYSRKNHSFFNRVAWTCNVFQSWGVKYEVGGNFPKFWIFVDSWMAKFCSKGWYHSDTQCQWCRWCHSKKRWSEFMPWVMVLLMFNDGGSSGWVFCLLRDMWSEATKAWGMPVPFAASLGQQFDCTCSSNLLELGKRRDDKSQQKTTWPWLLPCLVSGEVSKLGRFSTWRDLFWRFWFLLEGISKRKKQLVLDTPYLKHPYLN